MSDANESKLLSTNNPVDFLMIFMYDVSINIFTLYAAVYILFINKYPYLYYIDITLTNITKSDIIIYVLKIMINLIYMAVQIYNNLVYVNINGSPISWIFFIRLLYVLHIALVFNIITTQALIYGNASLRIILNKIKINEKTDYNLMETYKRYCNNYKEMFRLPQIYFAWKFLHLIVTIWRGFDNVLNIHMILYSCLDIIPMIFFLCQHTFYYSKLKYLVGNIIVKSVKGTPYRVQNMVQNNVDLTNAFIMRELIDFQQFNGNLFGYEFSYKRLLLLLLINFLLVRIISYALPFKIDT
eukprot:174826_1